MKLPILTFTVSISLFSGVLAASDEAGSASELARLAAQLELVIRVDGGREVLIETTDGVKYYPGDRVQLINGRSGTRVRRVRN